MCGTRNQAAYWYRICRQDVKIIFHSYHKKIFRRDSISSRTSASPDTFALYLLISIRIFQRDPRIWGIDCFVRANKALRPEAISAEEITSVAQTD